jgi:DNA-binding transcriptional regulator YiaG
MRPTSPWRTGCTTSIWPSSGEKVNEAMAKNVKDLQAKMSPESRARSEATAERLIREMALDELRAARALTQEHLSTLLGIKQSAVSKLERRADMYVSTLRHFIEAMGGQLEIRAVFPEGDVRITQFQTLVEPKAGRDSRPS